MLKSILALPFSFLVKTLDELLLLVLLFYFYNKYKNNSIPFYENIIYHF